MTAVATAKPRRRGAQVKGDTVRELRERAGYNTVTLAKIVGCHPSHLANVEAGRRLPSHDLARQLAGALRVELVDLNAPAPARN